MLKIGDKFADSTTGDTFEVKDIQGDITTLMAADGYIFDMRTEDIEMDLQYGKLISIGASNVTGSPNVTSYPSPSYSNTACPPSMYGCSPDDSSYGNAPCESKEAVKPSCDHKWRESSSVKGFTLWCSVCDARK